MIEDKSDGAPKAAIKSSSTWFDSTKWSSSRRSLLVESLHDSIKIRCKRCCQWAGGLQPSFIAQAITQSQQQLETYVGERL